jgi:hypothetical protein
MCRSSTSRTRSQAPGASEWAAPLRTLSESLDCPRQTLLPASPNIRPGTSPTQGFDLYKVRGVLYNYILICSFQLFCIWLLSLVLYIYNILSCLCWEIERDRLYRNIRFWLSFILSLIENVCGLKKSRQTHFLLSLHLKF